MSETVFVATRLRDLCARLTDGSHFSPAPQEVGHPIANVKDLRDGLIDLAKCTRISEAAFRDLFAAGCTISPGDVLLSKDGTVGKVVVYEQPDVIGSLSSICIMRPGKDIDRRFLGQALQCESVRRQIDNAMSGSALRRLVLREIAQISVPLPPLSEQQSIAKILDTLDEAIRRTEQIIAKLRQIKQGLLHDLLTRGIDENGELRDPERHPEQFKDSPLGRIPKAWEVRELKECVRPDAPITYGIVQAGPHFPGGIPYIRTGDMFGDALSIEGLLRTSPHIAASYMRSRVEAGELVCAIRATVGKVLPVPPELHGANLTQGTARISPSRLVDASYLLWALRSHSVQRQFDLNVKGTTFREITLAQLRKLSMPVPKGRSEQTAIAAALDHADQREKAEKLEAEKLGLLKQGLMEDLLTGRVRVTSLEAAA